MQYCSWSRESMECLILNSCRMQLLGIRWRLVPPAGSKSERLWGILVDAVSGILLRLNESRVTELELVHKSRADCVDMFDNIVFRKNVCVSAGYIRKRQEPIGKTH